MVGRSPFSLSLPWSMPRVASSFSVATSFQREYVPVIANSQALASSAEPTRMSRACPSKRSITTPRDSGKCLSGSASTTRPTVHFHPSPACLYASLRLISSLNAEAHSSENALRAMSCLQISIEDQVTRVRSMSFNLATMLRESALAKPDKVAVILDQFKLDYKTVEALSNQVAGSLQRSGVRKGDTVGLMLPNVPQFVIAYYGILKAGAGGA